MQQQLAKLQMNLEKVHENHSIIAQMREAAEDDQRKVREAYKGTYGEVSAQRQKVAKHQAELDQLGVKHLPRTLAEAVDAFEADPLGREVMGDLMFQTYIDFKRAEWESYHNHVSDWEVQQYLKLW